MEQKEQKITLASTIKSLDTEEKLDLYFYRPIGFRFALMFRALGITPNPVTIASIFIGMAGGYLFYYPTLSLNIIGMGLLVLANSLDSADGQLARMTNNKSRLGRLLDGLASSFWFIVITIALCLRLQAEGWPATIWILGVASGLSHQIQSSIADYYRNIHLYFILGKSGSEQDNSADLQAEYDKIKWPGNFWKKAMARFYLNYTRQQEALSPWLQHFMKRLRGLYGHELPEWLVTEFRQLNKPLMPLTNIIQFNTRVIFLFICLFIDQVWWYFVFDIVVLNAIMLYMIKRQEKISRHFFEKLGKMDPKPLPA